MHRFVAWFFVLLLPLQFAWGVAAAYCQHETTTAGAPHIGHHEHVHKADAKQAADSPLAGDTDCGFCHASGPAVTVASADNVAVPEAAKQGVPPAAPAHRSALARAPDRPQWPRLA
jgi:hypothetical protein